MHADPLNCGIEVSVGERACGRIITVISFFPSRLLPALNCAAVLKLGTGGGLIFSFYTPLLLFLQAHLLWLASVKGTGFRP